MVRADSRAMSDLHERVTRVWQGGVGPAASRALDVAARGYRGLLDAREWLYGRGVLRCRALGVPVVSVGNLTVGGTGKTPAVELVVRTLLALGHRPAVLSRGYGRRSHGIRVVADGSSMRLNADEAGDEPILLARRLPGVPVIVGAHRYGAGRVAVERFGVTALVLDDGFQHRTLAKDVEILMARARAPWGNGRLLPAGPMREPLAALARADLVVAVGNGALGTDEVASAVRRWAPHAPIVTAMLERRAHAASAVGLVTTEKDWMRFRALPAPAMPLYVLGVRLALLSGEAQWRAVLARACARPA